MSDRYLHLDAEFVKAEIGRLIAMYPELAEDTELRLGAIEGETDAHRIIERALNERQEAESLAGACHTRKTELQARQSRFERKADAMKELIRSVMKAAQLPKLVLPEATITLTKGRQSVCIEDLDSIPQGYFHLKKEADKTAIREAMESGEQIPGAALVLGSDGISIRTK